VDAHAHRIGPHADLARDLHRALAVEQERDEHRAVVRRELRERTLERGRELALRERLEGRGRVALRHARGIDLALAAPPRSARLVREDPEEPRHEGALGVPARRVLDRGEERGLHDVLRLRATARQVPRELEQVGSRGVEHLRQRPGVTLGPKALEALLQLAGSHLVPELSQPHRA
jgi:hypothetical protein